MNLENGQLIALNLFDNGNVFLQVMVFYVFL